MPYRRLVHNGTSFLLTIPPSFVQSLKMVKGDLCNVELNSKGQIIITPVKLNTTKGNLSSLAEGK